MSTSFQAVLDDYLDYYAQENSSWTEVSDDGNDGMMGANFTPQMWVNLGCQLVQSKQRMTEIIKHATSEEVSELFDCERVAA